MRTLHPLTPGFGRLAWWAHAAALLVSLAACSAGPVLLKDPAGAPVSPGLAQAADARMEVSVDALVSVNSPGSWARNAAWDEYRVRLTNLTEADLTVRQAVIVGQEDWQAETTGELRQLVKGSRAAARRLEQQGTQLDAGSDHGTALVVSGSTAVAGGVATSLAGLGGSATAASAAGLAAAGVIAAPILITAGLVQSHRSRRVAKELLERQVRLPLRLAAHESIETSLFFPVTPAPRSIEFSYSQAGLDHRLHIGLAQQPGALHLARNGCKPVVAGAMEASRETCTTSVRP